MGRAVKAFRREVHEGRPKPYYLAACVWGEAGATAWERWLGFHAAVGFEHFFVATPRGPAGDPAPLLSFESAGRVTRLPCEPEESAVEVLNHNLDLMRRAARWVAFLQPSEYLFSPANGDLRRTLIPYEIYAGVLVHALGFPWPGDAYAAGNNGGADIDAAVQREPGVLPDPGFIVNPAAVRGIGELRGLSFHRGRECVDESRVLAADAGNGMRSTELLRLHRYGHRDGLLPYAGSRRRRSKPPGAEGEPPELIEDRTLASRLPSTLDSNPRLPPPPIGSIARLAQWGRLTRLGCREAVQTLPRRHYLAACLIFRNSARYLSEWIEFHRLVGVEHFYLYNHNSTDDPLRVLQPYLSSGLVTLHDAEGDSAQDQAYRHCVRNYGRRARWIAFLDDDEFMYSPRQNSLAETLHAFEDEAGVTVPWLLFGSSGHVRRPEGLVLENYTRRKPSLGHLTKSVIDPARCTEVLDPHRFRFTRGCHCVTEDGLAIPHGQSRDYIAERLRINHYYTKSAEDVEDKLRDRGFFAVRRGYSFDEKQREYREAAESELLNAVEDRTIQRYLPALKQALQNPGGSPIRFAPPEQPG